jgi:predicted RNA-binding protein with PUA-like domain
MRYWLMKTEPDTFGIDDLKRVKTEPWSGVRNFTARNFMMSMELDDTVLFYHSSCPEPGIYGLGTVTKLAYPDKSQFDAKSPYFDARAKKDKPLWYNVDVGFSEKWTKPVLLSDLRANSKLKSMITLQPGSRLSVTPVTKKEFTEIRAMNA